MHARGSDVPLLVVSDGATGIIQAIETYFPRSEHQRCLSHRRRNLAAKVPKNPWPEFKIPTTACYQAPSRTLTHELADGSSPASRPRCHCRALLPLRGLHRAFADAGHRRTILSKPLADDDRAKLSRVCGHSCD